MIKPVLQPGGGPLVAPAKSAPACWVWQKANIYFDSHKLSNGSKRHLAYYEDTTVYYYPGVKLIAVKSGQDIDYYSSDIPYVIKESE